jgi:hypothetical protein
MDLTRFAALPAQLRAAADAMAALPDFATLPRLCGIRVGWDEKDNVLTLSAQMATTGDDGRIIAELGAWAAALESGLHLGEEVRNAAEYGYYWRNLSTATTLPDGTHFEVWNHLQYPVPAADTTVAAVPVAA